MILSSLDPEIKNGLVQAEPARDYKHSFEKGVNCYFLVFLFMCTDILQPE